MAYNETPRNLPLVRTHCKHLIKASAQNPTQIFTMNPTKTGIGSSIPRTDQNF